MRSDMHFTSSAFRRSVQRLLPSSYGTRGVPTTFELVILGRYKKCSSSRRLFDRPYFLGPPLNSRLVCSPTIEFLAEQANGPFVESSGTATDVSLFLLSAFSCAFLISADKSVEFPAPRVTCRENQLLRGQMDHSDSDLVHRSLHGEHAAFAEIYDRYARLVRAVCFEATGNIPDAQDVCQEVFVRAWQKLETLKNADRIGAWLTGIARHVCKEWQRNRRRLSDVADAQPCMQPPDTQGPSARSEGIQDCLDQLFESLQELTEKERMAIHLFYLRQESAEQARSVLRLSPSGFYRVLERARKRLARLMKQKERVRQ